MLALRSYALRCQAQPTGAGQGDAMPRNAAQTTGWQVSNGLPAFFKQKMPHNLSIMRPLQRKAVVRYATQCLAKPTHRQAWRYL